MALSGLRDTCWRLAGLNEEPIFVQEATTFDDAMSRAVADGLADAGIIEALTPR